MTKTQIWLYNPDIMVANYGAESAITLAAGSLRNSFESIAGRVIGSVYNTIDRIDNSALLNNHQKLKFAFETLAYTKVIFAPEKAIDMLMAFGGAVLDHKNTTISKQLSTNLQALYPDCANMGFVSKRIDRAPEDRNPFMYATSCLLREKRLTIERTYKLPETVAKVSSLILLAGITILSYDDSVAVWDQNGDVKVVNKTVYNMHSSSGDNPMNPFGGC